MTLCGRAMIRGVRRESRIPLAGNEFDALTDWRRVDRMRLGVRKAAKRRYRKRHRQQTRHSLMEASGEDCKTIETSA